MVKLLYTISWEGEEPTLEQICEKYGFEPEELDPKFGAIEIDPDEHLYSILVEEEAVQRLEGRDEDEPPRPEGPYADVRIAPFGPPEV